MSIVDRSRKSTRVEYPDGERTNILKVRKMGNTREAGSIYISVYNMRRLGWKTGDDLEILIRSKDKMAVIWKHEEEPSATT